LFYYKNIIKLNGYTFITCDIIITSYKRLLYNKNIVLSFIGLNYSKKYGGKILFCFVFKLINSFVSFYFKKEKKREQHHHHHQHKQQQQMKYEKQNESTE
jgi:UDP-N-acetylmuramyl pentapeptide phosphotransferase/UDP-N-acetylglucosamine-1-phosphate transferase